MEDLNASDIDAAVKMIEGTCRSMGVNVVETGGGPTPAAEDAEVADDSAEEPAEKSGSDSEATAEATTEDAAGDTAEEAAE